MRKLEVGQLFEEGKTQYKEGIKFDFDQSGGTLYIFYDQPTDHEIQEIRKGDLRIGLCTLNNIIFMLFKFGSLDWMDAPYNYNLSQEYIFEDLGPTQGFNMTIFLIDASNGILKAIRHIGWPNQLSRLFKQEVESQKEKDFNKIEYDRCLSDIYMKYSTRDLVRYGQTFKVRREGQ